MGYIYNAGSTKTAPRTLISIAMCADCSFELISIETYTPQFFGQTNLFLGSVYLLVFGKLKSIYKNKCFSVEQGSCSVSYLPNRSASARNSSVVVDYLKKKRASSQNILKENPELYQGKS